ncbi:MAG: hypothetical protein WCE23_06435 [Candidatus Binatus sp.]|uniref:hypothetical protein n=1 Tax=Candidatus Binatus sp. TaxID=2811406 RepID=UPI003C706CE6
MSLGIAIKGSEGIVLAADSRVTLFNQVPAPQVPGAPAQVIVIPANFDNATKVLTVAGQKRVAAVTYGLGSFITPSGPRTMHSFIPEFEKELKSAGVDSDLPVEDFAKQLSAFFKNQWDTVIKRPPLNPAEEINFLVGGFDMDAAYGRVFMFQIPTHPDPTEQNAGPAQFGITWGGQHDLVYRLLYGFDIELPKFVQTSLTLSDAQFSPFSQGLHQRFSSGIPFQFLPLQDCIDLAVFLIKNTIEFQKYRTTTVRGVGGPVVVGTITRRAGFQWRINGPVVTEGDDHAS